MPPEACPRCSSQKFREETWFCEQCLDAARSETVKLLSFLEDDFGLSRAEMRIFFSGHRGYHVHVESPTVKEMDQLARKEIVDYVAGTGFTVLDREGLRSKEIELGPPSGAQGRWGRRLRTAVSRFLLNATEQSLRTAGIRVDTAARMLGQREVMLDALEQGATWQIVKGMGAETLFILMREASTELLTHVDSVVTTDVHRLIRMAGTLHGKTGLRKMPVSASAMESFDPLRSSVAFEGSPITVHVGKAHQFRLGDNSYGPFADSTVELRRPAALLLLLKGIATLA